jgi:hypothetical protein
VDSKDYGMKPPPCEVRVFEPVYTVPKNPPEIVHLRILYRGCHRTWHVRRSGLPDPRRLVRVPRLVGSPDGAVGAAGLVRTRRSNTGRRWAKAGSRAHCLGPRTRSLQLRAAMGSLTGRSMQG